MSENSSFKKIDLHIHTPHSVCYGDMFVKPEQIVEAALVFGLDAIGISDHNSFEAVDEMRKVATKDGLKVFPITELTTRSGHFLAVFDLDSPVKRLNELLDEVGIPREHRGDAAAQVDGETEDVFKKVVDRGGLVIAAHIERWPSGFLETKESRASKMALHACPYLSALEITVPQDRQKWENGEMRGYPKKYACIQGSDAHSPNEVGRRPFYVDMETISLEALRTAFQNWTGNIAFPDEVDG
ncbi:MAG: PHP domain-containing protein [Dehalococcoidia bacterium]|nr:PHP domain-containing protein [Dehalococcoidia bacterium]